MPSNNDAAEKTAVDRAPDQSEQTAHKILNENSPTTQDRTAPDLAVKRAEDSQNLTADGKLPGVILDFGARGEQPGQSSDSRYPSGETAKAGRDGKPTIEDQHAQDVVGQVKKLEVKHSSVDLVSGEVYREPARNNEIANLATSLSVLSQNDISKIDRAYGDKGALQAIQDNKLIPEGDREKLALYAQGTEKRQDDPAITQRLAELSLQKGNIDDFKLAFAGAPQSARDAFFANKANSPDQGQQAIDRAFKDEDRVTATEFAKYGKVSTATEIRRETGGALSFTNYEGVERSLRHQSPAEVAQQNRGAELARQQQSGALDGRTLTTEQQQDLKAHTDMTDALKKAAGSNTTRLEYWKGLSLQGGQSSGFIDAVAGEGGKVYNGSLTDKLGGQTGAQQLKDNWDKQSYDFYNDKTSGAQRQELAKNVLGTFSNGPELVKQFDKQVKAPSYEESAKLAGKPQASDKPLAALNDLSATLPDGTVVTAAPADVLRAAEKGLKADPKLQSQIAEPKTADDLATRDKLRSNVASLVGDKSDAYQQYLKLESGQSVAPEAWAKLDKTSESGNHRPFFEDLGRQPKEQRDRIANDPQLKQSLIGHLDKDNQKIAEQVLSHGYQPADKLQAALLQKDAVGAEEAIKAGSKEDIGQFKKDYAATYGQSAETVAKSLIGGQKGIEVERILAGDKSAVGQFHVDQKIKEDLRNPLVDGIATAFGSNTPRRESESFAQYAGAVATPDAAPHTGPGSESSDESRRAQAKYRDDRDALNTTEKDVVNTATSIALTAGGAALTGGGGFATLSLLREGGRTAVTQYGTLTISSAANTYARSAALGRLHDGQASTYLKDATDGAALPYLGGGNLSTLGLGRVSKLAEEKVANQLGLAGKVLSPAESAAIKKSDFVTGIGHTAYPFSSNFAYAAGTELAKGESPSDALWKGATNGSLAALGVGSTWAITRSAKNFAPEAVADISKKYIGTPSLSTPLNRAGAGGFSKAEGNEARSKKPEGLKSDERTQAPTLLAGTRVSW